MMRDRPVKTYSKAKRLDYIPEDEIDEILPTPIKDRMREEARQAKKLALELEIEDTEEATQDDIKDISIIASDDEDNDQPNDDQCLETTDNTSDKEIRDAIRCLEPGRMLNDTIVDFYMNHLWIKSTDYGKNLFHIFNTFLYKKLKNMMKATDHGPAVSSQIRWDKNVDLFQKHFLVIPICDHAHWVLVIVCYPGVSPVNKEKTPCLMVFDSLGFKYMNSFTEPIRRFLQHRWNNDQTCKGQRDFLDRTKYKEYNAIVPRQKNAYDCGVHLLWNFHMFLKSPLTNWIHVIRNEQLITKFNCDTQAVRKEIMEVYSEKGNK